MNLILSDSLPDAFATAGIPWPGMPEPGKRKRFSTNPKKPSDASGWLSVFPDGDGAVFGCWREGQTFTWQRQRNGPEPTQAEREAWRKQAEVLRRAAEAEREAEYQQAADQARTIWKAGGQLTPDFPYLTKKGVKPHIARLGPDGRMTVPVRGPDGEIQSLQYIAPDGSKRFHTGGRMAGGWALLGTIRADEPILLAEGFATAATLHEASGKPVFCCFSAGNMGAIAAMLQSRYPGAVRLVCGDDDRHTEGNPGRAKANAAAKATGALLIFPKFTGTEGSDFNDMAQESGLDTVRKLVADAILKGMRTPFSSPPITLEEMANARSSPARIVGGMYFADVGLLIAPGGIGKTTLMLHIAAHICTGREVFGNTVHKPGPVLIVTAEDSREILVARLRSVIDSMGLSDDEKRTVLDGVRIADVSGGGFKLTEVVADVVLPSDNLAVVIAAAREINPVLIVIDPAVSFGVGESRVNDAEQGLIEAARKLRNELECCILYVHHSGKGNARDKTLDQYSGRGGSAFADGARMVHVLQSLDPDEWRKATGRDFVTGETGLVLARPKMSYSPAPGDIYISRRGYSFERVEPASVNKQAEAEARANQLWQWLAEELKHGRKHSKNTIEQLEAGGMTRAQIRAALAMLEVSGRVEMRGVAGVIQRGARTYLHPVASPSISGEASEKTGKKYVFASPAKKPFSLRRPYREINNGEPTRRLFTLVSVASPANLGEPTANPAKREPAQAVNMVEVEI